MVDELQRLKRAKAARDRADSKLHDAMLAADAAGFSLREIGEAAGFSHEYVRLAVARRRRAEELVRVHRAVRRARRLVRRALTSSR